MTYLTVRKIDGRLMLEIPADLAARLRVEDGGVITVEENGETSVVMTPGDDEVARQVELGLRAMDKFAQTFRDLAR